MPKQPTSIRLPDLTIRQLNELIAQTGMTQSELITTAIDRMYQNEVKTVNTYCLQIQTWPMMRGAPSGTRISYHATPAEAVAHLDGQNEPYAAAHLSRLVEASGAYVPCDWDGEAISLDQNWPERRGTNGEHPAYLAYLQDKPALIAEILRRYNEDQTTGILHITGEILRERHPLVTQTEALTNEIVELANARRLTS